MKKWRMVRYVSQVGTVPLVVEAKTPEEALDRGYDVRIDHAQIEWDHGGLELNEIDMVEEVE